jgi:hypothetical protein
MIEEDYEETQFSGHKVGPCTGQAMILGGGNGGRGADFKCIIGGYEV